jgi:hypothetical protein
MRGGEKASKTSNHTSKDTIPCGYSLAHATYQDANALVA